MLAIDKHGRARTFQIDNWILLKFPKARFHYTLGKFWQGEQTGHQKYYTKIARCYYRPFQIQEPINETTLKLKLPYSWKTHNDFHVILLKAFKGTPPMDLIHKDPLDFLRI